MATRLLEKTFAEASRLPEHEQEALAEWILAELVAEKRWQRAFADSPDALFRLADETVAEHPVGRTYILDL